MQPLTILHLTTFRSSIGKKRKSTDGEAAAEAEKEVKKAPTGTSSLTTALAPGVAVVSRKKHKAHAPNPLSAAKPSEDSANSKKKKERKFRKFY